MVRHFVRAFELKAQKKDGFVHVEFGVFFQFFPDESGEALEHFIGGRFEFFELHSNRRVQADSIELKNLQTKTYS